MKMITVVVPVFNRADLILTTLDSIVDSAMEPFDLIVVDNNSTDGSAQVVSRWAEAHRDSSVHITLLHEAQQGASAARNRGLAAVKTPWVMFFDSDDIMLPGHVQRVIDAIKINPNVDIIGWNVVNSDGKKLVFATDPWNILFRGSMATQRYCCRTELLRAVGGWNTAVSLWDDIELGSRLVARNPKAVKLCGKPTVRTIVRPDSISNVEANLDLRPIVTALEAMKTALPALASMTPFKKAIVAGVNHAADRQKSRQLLDSAVQDMPRQRKQLRFIWNLAKLKPPGITHITKLFITQR